MGYVDLNANKKTDWCTPPDCRELLAQLGKLKLDVCTGAHNAMGAEQFYTLETDGFKQSWECGTSSESNQPGLVWCNFEWSRETSEDWIDRACDQGPKMRDNGTGELVLLGPARPDTVWFRKLWASADALYFWKGRMTFYDPNTGAPVLFYSKKTKKWASAPVPVPTQLAYWGSRPAEFMRVFAQQGGIPIDLRAARGARSGCGGTEGLFCMRCGTACSFGY